MLNTHLDPLGSYTMKNTGSVPCRRRNWGYRGDAPNHLQRRVTFLAVSSPLFIYSKSDTPIFLWCGNLCTFVQICNIEIAIQT